MPAEHIIDDDRKVIITHWTGDLTDEALLAMIGEYNKLKSQACYFQYNELFDFTGIGKLHVTYNGLLDVAELASSVEAHANARLAIIVTSDMAFNMARMYITCRGFFKRNEKTLNVFKYRDAALKWLSEG